MSEKIQKVLANAGLNSRRQIENWLREGRISVNGQIAKLGDRMTLTDTVKVDGRIIHLTKSASQSTRVLLYHKPEGEMCTRSDPEGRPTVFDNLPSIRNGRWISIGRLDFNTSGLLLLTNDGEFANKLMHPSSHIEREYAIRIQGTLSQPMIQKLIKGVELEDGFAQFDQITDGGGEGTNHWYNVVINQGRNRIVRRLFESQGFKVSRLMRIRFGALLLPRALRRGQWVELTEEEFGAITDYID